MAQNPADLLGLPGGSASVGGLGESFSTDPFTGTGRFALPLALLPGRGGLTPDLTLHYSTGQGNGPFGLGWNLSVPAITRRTEKGLPTGNDSSDLFMLAGGDELVPVDAAPGIVRYRPRVEGSACRIEHLVDNAGDRWRVRTPDGITHWYGSATLPGDTPTTLYDPAHPQRIGAWMLSSTEDSFGNTVLYRYTHDLSTGARAFNQIYLSEIRYLPFDEPGGATSHCLFVRFRYALRPDPWSTRRQGFETRMLQRCIAIELHNMSVPASLIRRFELTYLDELVARGELPAAVLPPSGVSLLARLVEVGFDGTNREERPPIDFGWTRFDPARRRLMTVSGADLPPGTLARNDLALVDVYGRGIPDLVELSGPVARCWKNLGNGRFDLARSMPEAPAGFSLSDAGVQLMDADGDGRAELLVHTPDMSGWFPARWGGGWDRRGFRRVEKAPSFALDDPEVRLVDLDGDGITDALRSGSRLEAFYFDPIAGWRGPETFAHRGLDATPDVSLSDPRVRLADMTGDGLTDIVLVENGRVSYWPSFGRGRFGARIVMQHSPRLPADWDPRRLLLGDLDGDGVADLAYVDHGRVLVWMNRGGEGFGPVIEIRGTPPADDMQSITLIDLLGTGVPGILWSRDDSRGPAWRFLDLNGSDKPCLLTEIDNHLGVITRIGYRSSVSFCLEDDRRPETRWRTVLPIVVQTVERIESLDRISGALLTTQLSYHHGAWDGGDRCFVGFGRVVQRDTEVFGDYHRAALHPNATPTPVAPDSFSPPTETRVWYHVGPLGDATGEWHELDLAAEFFAEDPPMLRRSADFLVSLSRLERAGRRDVLRSLRGARLRAEIYALDGTARSRRPLDVSETLTEVDLVLDPAMRAAAVQGWAIPDGGWVVRPVAPATRSSTWLQGDEPITRIEINADRDAFGRPRAHLTIAVPRGRDPLQPVATGPAPEPFLALLKRTRWVAPIDTPSRYQIERVASATSWEIVNDGRDDAFTLAAQALAGTLSLRPQTHQLFYYDGAPFEGLPSGQLGAHGALVRTEVLVLTPDDLQAIWGSSVPPFFDPAGAAPFDPQLYPQEFLALTARDLGYRYHDNAIEPDYLTGFYRQEGRVALDGQLGQQPARGRVVAYLDPMGRRTDVTWDARGLLQVRVTDSAGLVTEADPDWRLLRSRVVTEPNGSRVEVHCSPLGSPIARYRMGRASESLGDRPDLGMPSERWEQDVLAYATRGEPVATRTWRRMQHAWDDPQAPEHLEVSYVDGFGRLVQTRAQAGDVVFGEPVYGSSGLDPDSAAPIAGAVGVERLPGQPENVVVSGWTRNDNKGRVVETLEPYFDRGFAWRAPPASATREGTRHYRDGRGAIVRLVHPGGFMQRTILGRVANLRFPDDHVPSAWESLRYDANDLELISHPARPPRAPAFHHFTPDMARIDALGRIVHAARIVDDGTGASRIERFTTYDMSGRVLTVTDEFGRTLQRHVYDHAPSAGGEAASPWRSEHLDGGASTSVTNAAGEPVLLETDGGARILRAYDGAGRLRAVWASDGTAEPVTKRQHVVWGDELPAAVQQAGRLAGRLARHYDEAGLVEYAAYDFKGNVLRRIRRPLRDEPILNAAAQGITFRVDWTVDPSTQEALLLDPVGLEMALRYDALDRAVEYQYPEDADGPSGRKSLLLHHDPRGHVIAAELAGQPLIAHVAYDAKGRILLAAWAAGVMTRYALDPAERRPARIRCERYQLGASAFDFQPVSSTVLRDSVYRYDPGGNLVELEERAPGAGVAGAPALVRRFLHDTIYRVVNATGREHDAPLPEDAWHEAAPGPLGALPDQQFTRGYEQRMRFDGVGNLLELRHLAGAASWTRSYVYGNNNRLLRLDEGTTSIDFHYDATGHVTHEGTSRRYEWDAEGRLRAFVEPLAGGGELRVLYLYSSNGEKTKRLVIRPSHVEVYVNCSGVAEHHYARIGPIATAGCHVHRVGLGGGRAACLRVGPSIERQLDPNALDSAALQLDLSDHLGSSAATLDGTTGAIIRQEEFYPFGGASFGSTSDFRERFAGQFRDSAAGIYLYGARPYAPWLGRFLAVDPIASRYPWLSPYAYAANRLSSAIDLDGLEDFILNVSTDYVNGTRTATLTPFEGKNLYYGYILVNETSYSRKDQYQFQTATKQYYAAYTTSTEHLDYSRVKFKAKLGYEKEEKNGAGRSVTASHSINFEASANGPELYTQAQFKAAQGFEFGRYGAEFALESNRDTKWDGTVTYSGEAKAQLSYGPAKLGIGSSGEIEVGLEAKTASVMGYSLVGEVSLAVNLLGPPDMFPITARSSPAAQLPQYLPTEVAASSTRIDRPITGEFYNSPLGAKQTPWHFHVIVNNGEIVRTELSRGSRPMKR